jgi:hypothetical protein
MYKLHFHYHHHYYGLLSLVISTNLKTNLYSAVTIISDHNLHVHQQVKSSVKYNYVQLQKQTEIWTTQI